MQLQAYLQARPEVYRRLFGYLMALELQKPADPRAFGRRFMRDGPAPTECVEPPRQNFAPIELA